jgi:hypothetical protein
MDPDPELDPDLHQNVTDHQHCQKAGIQIISFEELELLYIISDDDR